MKKEAYRRITSILPEWKQRNLAARALELVDKRESAPLTSEEEAEIIYIKALWSQIKDIRLQSDTIETEIEALSTLNDVNNYDITNNPNWP